MIFFRSVECRRFPRGAGKIIRSSTERLKRILYAYVLPITTTILRTLIDYNISRLTYRERISVNVRFGRRKRFSLICTYLRTSVIFTVAYTGRSLRRKLKYSFCVERVVYNVMDSILYCDHRITVKYNSKLIIKSLFPVRYFYIKLSLKNISPPIFARFICIIIKIYFYENIS